MRLGGWYVRVTELFRGIWMDDVLRGGRIVPVPSHYFSLCPALRSISEESKGGQ